MRRVDPVSFATMVGALRRLRAALNRLLVRQVIIRPEGIVGAISGGIMTAWTLGAFVACTLTFHWRGREDG